MCINKPNQLVFMKITIVIIILLGLSQLLIAQKADAIKEYNSGLKYYNMHNYKDAIPFFEAAVKKDKTFVYAFRALINCLQQEGHTQQVAELYERVVELSPSDKAVCYNLALTYIDLKDYGKATLYLKKALSIDAGYVKAANKLQEVQAFLAKKNTKKEDKGINNDGDSHSIENKAYSAALKDYREENYTNCLAKLNAYNGEVTNPDFYYLKAIALQHLGERENAIHAYEETLELDDRHFNANLNLGKIYYNDKNFEEAIPLFETAYSRRKNDMQLLYILAKAHFYAKEYQEAIPYMEDYTQRDHNKAEAWTLLGDSYSKIGKSKNAAKAYEEAKKHGGNTDNITDHLENNVAKYGRKASEYTKAGNYQQAIAVLEQGITEHSEAASLHFNLGLNYMEVGNSKKAREEFKRTIDLEPAHAKAYQGLGLIYYEREEFGEAAAYYLATIDAGKHDELVYYKLGSCYFKLNRFREAVGAYLETLKLNAKEKRFHFALGLAYMALDEHLKAIKAQREALKLDPDYLDAQYNICLSLFKTSRFDECIAEAEKILEKDDKYAKAYLIIGHVHKRMRNYLLAEEFQKKAERLDPTLKQ